MPYGMTAMEWAWRYQNRTRNRVIETTDCEWCGSGPEQVCTTKTGNHTYDVHVGRIQSLYEIMDDAPHARRSTAIMEGI